MTTVDITSVIRMEVCCVEATAVIIEVDFGTGWRIMVGVEGNGMDVESGR